MFGGAADPFDERKRRGSTVSALALRVGPFAERQFR